MYQYDAANTGHNPDASGPKTEGEIAWRYSACTAADSGAVVRGGRVYAGGLVLNGRTGERSGGTWGGGRSTPAVVDETMYVSATDLEAQNATTGEELWTFQTDGDMGGLPAPTVVDNTVYVPGNIDDPTLYAVDAETGAEQWRFQTEADINTPPAVAAGTIYLVDKDDTVYALESETGEGQWQATHDGEELWRSAPVAVDDRIYLGSWRGAVLALHADDGSRAWRQRPGPPDFRIGSPVAVADGTVFAGGREGMLVALDATNGQIEWQVSTETYELSAPAIANGVVYVGSSGDSGTLFSFDAVTGNERWRVETREVLFSDHNSVGVNLAPAVVDDLVYVATEPGDLYAVTEKQ
jgi:outer membrane protein assembly factor BamB